MMSSIKGIIAITVSIMVMHTSCTKEGVVTEGAYKIVHDTDDQSLQCFITRSDGGYMGSVINTYSENSRSLEYGLMSLSPGAELEFHKRHEYYFANVIFNSIIESSPGQFLGVGYNAASTANRRSFLMKFDQTGEVKDSLVLLVNGSRVRYGKIKRLNDGNFILMASCIGAGAKTAAYFMKFSENLVKIWEKVVEGSDLGITHFRGFDFAEIPTGHIVAAGINGALSTVSGMYNEGRLAVAKLSADGLLDTFHVLQYNRFRIIGNVVLDNDKIHVFSSARVIENAGGKRELSINSFNFNLDSLDQRRIRHGLESWLDANFMVKRNGGWFVSGFAETGPTFFYYAQKPYLFMLDENFNVVSSRRFGSERVASFVYMMESGKGTYVMAYGDYLPGATRYGYDIIIEELDNNGQLVH